MGTRDSTLFKVYFWLFWVVVAVQTFLWLGRAGRHAGCWAQALTAVAPLAAERGLWGSAVRARASLLRCMWGLPGPGLEPVSPALAGGFPTTEHHGAPDLALLRLLSLTCHHVHHTERVHTTVTGSSHPSMASMRVCHLC